MANRFFITAQMKLLPPANLKQVAKDIKTAFKSINTIETKIKLPSNFAAFKRKLKSDIQAVSGIELKLLYPSSMSKVKKRLNTALRDAADVPIKLTISKSAEATIKRLHAKIQKAGTVNVNVNLPKGINSTLRLLLQLKSKTITVSVGSNNATKSLQSTAKAAATAANEIERFGAQSAAAIRRYAALTLVASGFYTLFEAFRKSVSGAIEFEKELIKIRQVTGLAVQDLSGLSSEVTRLSTGLGVSSQKLLNVAQILAQAGYNAEDTRIALETLAKTELSATFEDIENTTEGAIALMAQFGKNVRDLEKDMSAINSVSAKFAVESSDIITALRRTGGAFQAAGGSLEELLGLFTSVRATTRESAESISTGLRTIFTRLQRTRTQNFLESLGIDLKDDKGLFVGPFKAIARLSKALDGISNKDPRFAQILEELGGFRQIGKSIPLIKQFNIALAARDVALRSGNSLTEDSIKAQDSFANKLTKLKERFDAVIRTLVSSDAFKDSADFMLNMANSAIQLTSALTKLLPALQSFALVGGSFLATQYTAGFFGKGVPQAINPSSITGASKNSSFTSSINSPVSNALAYTGLSNIGSGGLNRGLTSAAFLGGPIGALLGGVLAKPGEEVNKFSTSIGNAVSQLGVLGLGFAFLNKKLTSINVGRLVASGQVQRQQAISNLKAVNAANANNIGPTRAQLLAGQNVTNVTKATIGPNGQARKAAQLGVSIDKFVFAGAAVSAITSELAAQFNEMADAELKLQNYSSYQRNKSIEGTLNGGNNALLIGGALALVIAPFSTAAAAVVATLTTLTGAIWGFASANQKAAEEVRMAQFKSEFDKEVTYLQRSKAGEVNPELGIGRVESKFTGFRDKLVNASSAREKESIRGSIDSSLIDLGTFINTIALNRKSFEDLDKELHNAISIYAEFSNQTLDEYKKNLEEIIRDQVIEQKALENLAKAQDQEIRRIREIEGLLTSIGNLTHKVDNFADSLEQFDSIFSGNPGAFGAKVNTSIFENIRNGSDGRFNSVTQSIGSFFGDTGNRLADSIKSVPDIISSLPRILQTVANQPAFSDSGEFVDRFKDEIGNLSPELRDVLASQVTKLIGRESKPDKLLDDIEANVYDVADKIAEGLKQFINPFKEAAPVIENILNVFTQGLAKYRDITFQLIDRQNQIADSETALANKRVEFNRGDFRQQYENQLSNNKANLNRVLGSRAGASAQSLGLDRNKLENQIKGIDDKLRKNPKFDDFTKLTEEREKLAEELGRVTKGLEMLGESAHDATVLEEMYNRVKEENQPRRDLIKAYTFGTNSERMDINTTIAATARLAQTRNIESIPETLRAGVLSMLDNFGESKVFGVNARQLSEDTQVNFLKNNLGMSEADARANVQKTQEEGQLQQRILDAQQKSIDAQKIYAESITTSQQELKAAIYNWIAEIRKQSEIDLLEKQRQTEDQNKNGIVTGKAAIEKRQSDITTLGKKIGIDLTQPNNIKYLKNNLNEINSLDAINKEYVGVQQAKIKKDYNVTKKEDIFNALQQELGSNFSTQELTRIAEAKGKTVRQAIPGGGFIDTTSSDLEARREELKKIQKEKLDSIDKRRSDIHNSIYSQFTPEQASKVLQSLDEVNKAFSADGLLENLDSFQELTDSIQGYTEQLNKIDANLSGLNGKINDARNGTQSSRFATGGRVKGFGGGDTVKALLTPGEYVLNKKAVSKIGATKLDAMNFGHAQKFADGSSGPVKLNPFSGGKSNRQLLRFIGEANRILGPLGINIGDIVGENIFSQQGLTNSKGHTARGAYSAGGRLGSFPKNSIILNPQAAGVNTIVEEALHGLDYKSSNEAKDFITSSQKTRTPMAKIAKLFGDKAGIEALADVEGYNLRDADIQKYLARPTERFAKATKHALKGGKGLERLLALVPDKVKSLQEIMPELSEYIKKPTIADRIGKFDPSQIQIPNLSKDTTFKIPRRIGTTAGVRVPFSQYVKKIGTTAFEKVSPAFGKQRRIGTTARGKIYGTPPVFGQNPIGKYTGGPSTSTPNIAGNLPSPEGVYQAAEAKKTIYPNYRVKDIIRKGKFLTGPKPPSFLSRIGSGLSKFGSNAFGAAKYGVKHPIKGLTNVLNHPLFGPVSTAIGAVSNRNLIDGKDDYGNTTGENKSVEFMGRQLIHPALDGLGGYLHNAMSGLTGTTPLKSGEGLASLAQETVDLNYNEQIRSAHLDKKVSERQAKIRSETDPAFKQRKAEAERLNKQFHQHITEQNVKQKSSDEAAKRESPAAKELREKYGFKPGMTAKDLADKGYKQSIDKHTNDKLYGGYGYPVAKDVAAQEEEKRIAREKFNSDVDKRRQEQNASLKSKLAKTEDYSNKTPSDGSISTLTPSSSVNKSGSQLTDEEVQLEIEKRAKERSSRLKQNKLDVEAYRKQRDAQSKSSKEQNKKYIEEYRNRYRPGLAENKAIIKVAAQKRAELEQSRVTKTTSTNSNNISGVDGVTGVRGLNSTLLSSQSASTVRNKFTGSNFKTQRIPSKQGLEDLLYRGYNPGNENPSNNRYGPDAKDLLDRGYSPNIIPLPDTHKNSGVPYVKPLSEQTDAEKLGKLFGRTPKAAGRDLGPQREATPSGGNGGQPPNIEGFSSSVNVFNTAVQDLGKILNAFPHTISLEANHKVEVIFNGAEVLQSLLPQIEQIAVNKAKEALTQYTSKNNMPAVDNTVGQGGKKK